MFMGEGDFAKPFQARSHYRLDSGDEPSSLEHDDAFYEQLPSLGKFVMAQSMATQRAKSPAYIINILRLFSECQCFFEKRAGACRLSEGCKSVCQNDLRIHGKQRFSQFCEDGDALLRELEGAFEVTLGIDCPTEIVQTRGNTPHVTNLAEKRKAIFTQLASPVIFPVVQGTRAQHEQGFSGPLLVCYLSIEHQTLCLYRGCCLYFTAIMGDVAKVV